jgi:hypothetical protein
VSSNDVVRCPFVYSNGKRCTGVIRQARAYGPLRGNHYVDRDDVRAYRLWCSDKDDHAGAVSSSAGKVRMEFYPNELEPGVEDLIWRGDLLG